MSERLVVHEHAAGDGSPTFVLLHAGVADGRAWDPVALRLATSGAGCRVLAPDLRGFGGSPDPTGDFRHVDDVVSMLDDAGVVDPVCLVGWSMSGIVALELALDHPGRVGQLALVCSVPSGMPRSQAVHDAWAREEALLDAGDVDGAIANDVQVWGAGAGRTAGDLEPGLVAYMEEVARSLLEREHRAVGDALDGDRDALARLDQLRAPLLLVTADLDTPCHEQAAATMLGRVPDARHERLTGTAHMAPLEQPEQVARLLLAHARSVG